MTRSDTPTHENGVGLGLSLGCRPERDDEAASVFGAIEPVNEPGPRPHRRTPTCRPRGPGSTKSNLLLIPEVASCLGSGEARPMDTCFEVIHHCCAGLDVHQATIWACRRRIGSPGAIESRRPPLPDHDRRPAPTRRRGWSTKGSRSSPWSPPGSTGSRSSTSWKAGCR